MRKKKEKTKYLHVGRHLNILYCYDMAFLERHIYKPLQGMAPTECLLNCLLACLPACLLAFLLACLLACLPACLPASLFASLLACLIACLRTPLGSLECC